MISRYNFMTEFNDNDTNRWKLQLSIRRKNRRKLINVLERG